MEVILILQDVYVMPEKHYAQRHLQDTHPHNAHNVYIAADVVFLLLLLCLLALKYRLGRLWRNDRIVYIIRDWCECVP